MARIEEESRRINTAPHHTPLTPGHYYKDISAETGPRTQRVVVQDMYTQPDVAGGAILTIVGDNPPQEADKEYYTDYYSRMVGKDGIIYALNKLIPPVRNRAKALQQETLDFLDRFEEKGIKLTVTNEPKGLRDFLDRFTGVLHRNHIKGAAVVNTDETIFYFGGVNNEMETVKFLDFMVKFRGNIADRLLEQFDRIHENPPVDDDQVRLSEDTLLLIDAGIPGKSVILKMGVSMIEDAQDSVQNTAALFPDGPVAKALSNADRSGKEVEVLSCLYDWPGFKPPYSVIHAYVILNWISQKLNRSIPVLFIPSGIHAKLLITDKKRALFGSHNLSKSGVRAGTREWAIYTENPELVENLVILYDQFRQTAVTS